LREVPLIHLSSLSIILNNQGAAIPATLAAVEKTDVSSGNRPYIG